MITRLKSLLILTAFLFATILLPLSVIAQQTNNRIIRKISERNEPIKITQIKVKDVVVEFDEKFQADNNWLRDLTVSVTNTSEKAIRLIDLGLMFTRTEGQQPPAFDHLFWGRSSALPNAEESTTKVKVMKPGESFDLTFSEKEYQQMRNFLWQTNYSESIDQIKIMISEIWFEGDKDKCWMSGQMYYRDPNNNRLWLPLKSENQ